MKTCRRVSFSVAPALAISVFASLEAASEVFGVDFEVGATGDLAGLVSVGVVGLVCAKAPVASAVIVMHVVKKDRMFKFLVCKKLSAAQSTRATTT